MSERKVVSYDDTYADKFDNGIGHGTHVAGLVGGAVLAGSGSDPGSGVAPDAKLHFFDMAVGDSVVYDPGVARLFNSFYSLLYNFPVKFFHHSYDIRFSII